MDWYPSGIAGRGPLAVVFATGMHPVCRRVMSLAITDSRAPCLAGGTGGAGRGITASGQCCACWGTVPEQYALVLDVVPAQTVLQRYHHEMHSACIGDGNCHGRVD